MSDEQSFVSFNDRVRRLLTALGIQMDSEGNVTINAKMLRALDMVAVNDLYQQNAAVDGRLVISNCGTVKVKNATKLI